MSTWNVRYASSPHTVGMPARSTKFAIIFSKSTNSTVFMSVKKRSPATANPPTTRSLYSENEVFGAGQAVLVDEP